MARKRRTRKHRLEAWWALTQKFGTGTLTATEQITYLRLIWSLAKRNLVAGSALPDPEKIDSSLIEMQLSSEHETVTNNQIQRYLHCGLDYARAAYHSGQINDDVRVILREFLQANGMDVTG